LVRPHAPIHTKTATSASIGLKAKPTKPKKSAKALPHRDGPLDVARHFFHRGDAGGALPGAAGAATLQALLIQCACVAPGECQAQCGATYCTDATTSTPECDACLNASSCPSTVRATYASNGGDCAALLACVDGQACKSKP
jgi:hypothetical protein